MSAAIRINTRRGLRAWAARRIESLNVAAKLHWLEGDREFLASQIDALPHRLQQLDRDLAELRVVQALLRSQR